LAERAVEADSCPAFSLSVEEATFGDLNLEHFLQTHGLRAQLHFVGEVGLGFATFVLDWNSLAN